MSGTTEGAGWTCGYCMAWVPYGNSHSCAGYHFAYRPGPIDMSAAVGQEIALKAAFRRGVVAGLERAARRVAVSGVSGEIALNLVDNIRAVDPNTVEDLP